MADRLLPPMKLQFEVTLQDDAELIFQNDGTDRRIVVTKLELWIPRLQMTSAGKTMIVEKFFKPTKWVYLKETLIPTAVRRDQGSQMLISPGVKNAKHVFVFFQRPEKQNSLTQNPYIIDTFIINASNDNAKLATCRLQYGGLPYWPELEYESEDLIRIRRDLIQFRYRKNDYSTGTQLDVSKYASLYPVIYFDLRATKERLEAADSAFPAEWSSRERLHNLRRGAQRGRNHNPSSWGTAGRGLKIFIEYKMATVYLPFRIVLTAGQQSNLKKAVSTKTGVTLRLKPGQIGQGDNLPLTHTQVARIRKAASAGHGADLKLSKTQIAKLAKSGGNIFSTALSLARPFLAPAAKTACKALATAGLSFGAEKLLKKIFGNGFDPQEVQLYRLVKRLNPGQKKELKQQLVGRGLVRRGGTAQYGGFLGMLASVRVPLAIDLVSVREGDALPFVLGKGMHFLSRRSFPPPPPPSRRTGGGEGKGMHIQPPPPFFGSWDDYQKNGEF